jgi:hypothetical protein
MMIVEYVSNRRFLDRDSLDFIERNLILPAVIKLGGPRRFMVGDLLRRVLDQASASALLDLSWPYGLIKPPSGASCGIDQPK